MNGYLPLKSISTTIVLLSLLILPRTLAAGPATIDQLTGLWGAERVFRDAKPVTVTVHFNEQENNTWFAHALGESTDVVFNNDSVSFTFPNSVGAFRGAKTASDGIIVGHWISPPSEVVYSNYATPLTLEPIFPGVWRGQVTPIEHTFSLYFSMSSAVDGKVNVLFRNPERNQGRYSRVTHAERENELVRFLNADGEQVLQGRFDASNDVLSIYFPNRGGSYDLTRRDRSEAVGFYPRRNGDAYHYQTPRQLDDGWQAAEPTSVNMRTDSLEALVQSIASTEVSSIRTPYIHSVLAARHGKLILEEYFYGFHADRTHDMRSASKSFTGILVGQAIDEIASLTVDSPVYPIFNQSKLATDKNRKALTVKHLISMVSGYDCDDDNYDSPGNEDRMQEQSDEPNWWLYTLKLPMARAPGLKAVYCSGGINLAGGVISASTGVWLPEFFRSRLAEPLQIDTYHMNLDPMDRGYAGGGLQLRPRDALKFGQLMLDGGQWNGQQVVPKEWVAQALKPHASIHKKNDYGYTWWRSELEHKGQTVGVYSATGNGGQLVVVVPALDLTVSFNAGNYGDFRTWITFRDELIPKYIFRAIAD